MHGADPLSYNYQVINLLERADIIFDRNREILTGLLMDYNDHHQEQALNILSKDDTIIEILGKQTSKGLAVVPSPTCPQPAFMPHES